MPKVSRVFSKTDIPILCKSRTALDAPLGFQCEQGRIFFTKKNVLHCLQFGSINVSRSLSWGCRYNHPSMPLRWWLKNIEVKKNVPCEKFCVSFPLTPPRVSCDLAYPPLHFVFPIAPLHSASHWSATLSSERAKPFKNFPQVSLLMPSN